MHNFNFKSLAFYGVAIGFVLVLFKVVTAYGENSLKAPVAIDGRYRLSFTPNVPSCLRSNNLVLNVEQSGIYLNGSLLPAETTAQNSGSAEGKPYLSGLLSNQQLNLSGKVPSSLPCSANNVRIQSRVEGENVEGKLILSSIPQPIKFTAQKQAPIQPTENSSSH